MKADPCLNCKTLECKGNPSPYSGLRYCWFKDWHKHRLSDTSVSLECLFGESLYRSPSWEIRRQRKELTLLNFGKFVGEETKNE